MRKDREVVESCAVLGMRERVKCSYLGYTFQVPSVTLVLTVIIYQLCRAWPGRLGERPPALSAGLQRTKNTTWEEMPFKTAQEDFAIRRRTCFVRLRRRFLKDVGKYEFQCVFVHLFPHTIYDLEQIWKHMEVCILSTPIWITHARRMSPFGISTHAVVSLGSPSSPDEPSNQEKSFEYSLFVSSCSHLNNSDKVD